MAGSIKYINDDYLSFFMHDLLGKSKNEFNKDPELYIPAIGSLIFGYLFGFGVGLENKDLYVKVKNNETQIIYQYNKPDPEKIIKCP